MTIAPSSLRVCDRPLEDCLRLVEDFHGCRSPGIVLGLFMVDRARILIGPAVEADVIAETRHCLPDAVQLFTPCTVGNGWLKIVDRDCFALTFFDRHSRRGYRVWLDLEKARAFPNLYNWYLRRVSKQDLPLETLLATIVEARGAALSSVPVTLTRFYARDKKDRIAVCPGCGEAYRGDPAQLCDHCRGDGYWRPSATHTGLASNG